MSKSIKRSATDDLDLGKDCVISCAEPDNQSSSNKKSRLIVDELDLEEGRELCSSAIDAVMKVFNTLKTATAAIHEQQRLSEEMNALMKQHADNRDKVIKLEVGGKSFQTYRDTLTRVEGTYFYSMLSSGSWLPNDKGVYVIDAHSEAFERILEYFSSGKLSYVGLSREEISKLEANLDYFQINAPRKSWEFASSIELKGSKRDVTCVVEQTDGKLCSSSLDGSIRVWDINTGSCSKTISFNEESSIWSMITTSEDKVCVGSFEHTVEVRCLKSGEVIKSVDAHDLAVMCLLSLSDGRIASASSDGSIKIWNSDLDRCELILTDHSDAVWSVIQLSDSRLCSVASDGLVKVWDLSTGMCALNLTANASAAFSVLELSDKRVVSGHGDASIKLWDLSSSSIILTFLGHTSAVRALVQLWDGRFCSGSADASIRIWNIDSGTCMKALLGHSATVYQIIELKDGRLCSASEDTTLRIWS